MGNASKRGYSLQKLGAIYDKTEGRCAYCGRKFDPFGDWIVEHIIPRSRDGSSVIDNLVLACQSCNQQKKSRNLEEFRAYMKEKPRLLLEDTIAKLERISSLFDAFPDEVISMLQQGLRAVDGLKVKFCIDGYDYKKGATKNGNHQS